MVLGVMIASLLAQAEPDVAQILKKVSETYAHPRQYDFAGKAQPRGDSKKESFSFRIAAKSPDKARLELRGSMAAELVGFETDLISVVGGAFTWTYLSKPNQYSKEKGAPSGEIPEAARETAGPTAFVRHLESLFFVRYREFFGMADRATLLRSETIEAGGGKPECFVIRIKSDSPIFQGEYT